MTLQAAAAAAADRLQSAGTTPDEARREAALLARAVLGWDTARWLVDHRQQTPAGFREAFDRAVNRRAAHEPIAYITGTREFFGHDFLVSPAVLVPRPETERLVEAAIARVHAHPTAAPLVVDVGTGSGCIALSIAAACPDARVVATDVSQAALDVARKNAERLDLAGRVDFRLGSMLAALREQVDVLVSNPPYVRERDRTALPRDVVDYEPALALFGGADGLDVIRTLIEVAADVLGTGAWLLFEIGFDQRDEVLALTSATRAFESVEVLPDLEGRPRVVQARSRACGPTS